MQALDRLADVDILTPPYRRTAPPLSQRDTPRDPLLLPTPATAGSAVSDAPYRRNLFPPVTLPHPEIPAVPAQRTELGRASAQTYLRRGVVKKKEESFFSDPAPEFLPSSDNSPPSNERPSTPIPLVKPTPENTSGITTSLGPELAKPLVQVKCMARTRIPTPHGLAFLHLYHNNRDAKEHLAIVIDPAQFSDAPAPTFVPPIRSLTLDAVWSENETEMDRITRGAYVGRLSPTSHRASDPPSSQHPDEQMLAANIPAPLIRIHSECFTGETVGSMRCDCGEQLDEAIRRISQPITVPGAVHGGNPLVIPGRGVVVYLRQEGRGIGLLSKIRAYNLQDLGHDTVTANLMLGHRADERGYEIAGAILRDLSIGGGIVSEGVRVLTNNPDKVEALEKEGVHVVERVAMVPRSWQCRQHQSPSDTPASGMSTPGETPRNHIPGATLIGGNAAYGEDLDKYLRTKITRMGHMLPLWMDEHEA